MNTKSDKIFLHRHSVNTKQQWLCISDLPRTLSIERLHIFTLPMTLLWQTGFPIGICCDLFYVQWFEVRSTVVVFFILVKLLTIIVYHQRLNIFIPSTGLEIFIRAFKNQNRSLVELHIATIHFTITNLTLTSFWNVSTKPGMWVYVCKGYQFWFCFYDFFNYCDSVVYCIVFYYDVIMCLSIWKPANSTNVFHWHKKKSHS